jgi:hypothetical protein
MQSCKVKQQMLKKLKLSFFNCGFGKVKIWYYRDRQKAESWV